MLLVERNSLIMTCWTGIKRLTETGWGTIMLTGLPSLWKSISEIFHTKLKTSISSIIIT